MSDQMSDPADRKLVVVLGELEQHGVVLHTGDTWRLQGLREGRPHGRTDHRVSRVQERLSGCAEERLRLLGSGSFQAQTCRHHLLYGGQVIQQGAWDMLLDFMNQLHVVGQQLKQLILQQLV